MLSVAENNACLTFIVLLCNIGPVSRMRGSQVIRLMPEDIDHTYLQSTCNTCRIGRRNVGQWGLAQLKLLQFLGTISTAEHFDACFTIGGLHHVAIDGDGIAFVGKGKVIGKGDERVCFIARQVYLLGSIYLLLITSHSHFPITCCLLTISRTY